MDEFDIFKNWSTCLETNEITEAQGDMGPLLYVRKEHRVQIIVVCEL